MTRPPARRIVPIVALLAASAVATAVASATTGPSRHASVPVVAGFALALVAAEALLVRFRAGDDTVALNLFEAVLVPMIVAVPGPVVVAAVAGSQAVAAVIRRNTPLKASFNVAQWAAAAGVASVVVAALGARAALTAHTIGSVVVALTAVTIVNAVSFSAVLRIVQRTTVRQAVASVARSFMLTFGVNASFGILFLSAYATHPGAIATFFVPLGFLHAGFRGYTQALADRRMLAGLHRATEALAAPINPREALPRFLAEVRACFGAASVELAIAGRGTVLRSPEAAPGDAEAARHRDRIAAELVAGDRVAGVLSVYDRAGAEGNAAGERAVLDAMARAAAAALQKADLLEEILEERRKLADIVAYSSDGIFTAAPDGTILTWNPALETATGHSAARMVGRRSLAVLAARDEDGAAVPLDGWAGHAGALAENVLVTTATGETRALSCSYTIVPAADGSPALLVAVARDKTNVREIERLREDFVAAVSHELRTPLTPIKGFAETLLERNESLTPAARASAARSIARQAERLERLITNLLEMTKVERGVTTRPVEGPADAAGAAAKVVADFRAAHPDRAIGLVLPVEPALAHGDALWIEQIVSNLLSNALKYSPAGEPVEVSVAPGPERLRIVVQDRGPGIAPGDRDLVFERFRRLGDDVTRSTGGAGIGLYISRQLARVMDGEITVEPSPCGARLALTLRTAQALAAVG